MKETASQTLNPPHQTCNTVLLVEDDAPLRTSLAQTFELADLNVIEAGTVIEAEDHISEKFNGVVVSDIRLPGKDGFDLLSFAKKQDPDLPIILLTGAGDIPLAVRAITEGASEFLEKPCHPNDLVKKVLHWLRSRALIQENRRLRQELYQSDAVSRGFPGKSPAIRDFRKKLREYAELPAHLHICGPEGIGKTSACQIAHQFSNTYGEIVSVETAQLDEKSVADATREAAGGTLVFEGIEGAKTPQRDLVLRCMEQATNVRTISTSRTGLADLAEQGVISPKHFFALNVLVLPVPTLDQRREDLPELFAMKVVEAAERMNRVAPSLSKADKAAISKADWPGNLPQLATAAQRFALGLDPNWDDKKPEAGKPGLADQLNAFERLILVEALRSCRGKTEKAARELAVPLQTFYDKLRKHNLKASDFRVKHLS